MLRFWVGLVCSAVVATAYAPTPAASAVRRCGAVVSSEIVMRKSDFAARKQAMDEWHAKARKYGQSFDSWRIAAWKSLKCFERKGGRFECVAFGAPCIIQQNPNAKFRAPRAKA
jgi:hypothetical protein